MVQGINLHLGWNYKYKQHHQQWWTYRYCVSIAGHQVKEASYTSHRFYGWQYQNLTC